MAKRAGHADPRQHVLAIDGFDRTLEADHRVQLQQRHRGVGAFQIDGSVLNARHDRRRQGFGINLQTNRQHGHGVNGGAERFIQISGEIGLVEPLPRKPPRGRRLLGFDRCSQAIGLVDLRVRSLHRCFQLFLAIKVICAKS